MCQHVFDVPGRAEPSPSLPPIPLPAVRPLGDPAPSPLPAFPSETYDGLSAEDRRAVDSASAWLRGAGMVGWLHLLFCACVSFAFLGHNDLVIIGYCGSYLFQ